MYSPFVKATADLEPPDLAALRIVSEGWYVEYKSELVNTRALAKGISAFANTYGGWLFIGVRERDKNNPVAGSFPGVPATDLESAVNRLRQAASEHLNPAPRFETKLLRGPCAEIGLAAETAIVVVEVPQSHMAPHVHKDGRIYRRVADGSEPKPETDRFILDQLWRRADSIREIVRTWVARDPEFSDAEANVPYVRLLMCTDPWRLRDSRLSAAFSQVRSIVTTEENSLPFDTFYSTVDGFIARQAKGNDPNNYVLTWRIWRDLSSEVLLPLPLYAPVHTLELAAALDGYLHGQRFEEILGKAGCAQPRIADLNFLLGLLVGIASKYRRLLALVDGGGRFYFKARILNTWRSLPFVDVGEILDEYERHGLPIAIDRSVTFPIGDGPESFRLVDEIEVEAGEPGEDRNGVVQALDIFAGIALALGVPVLREGGEGTDTSLVGSSEWAAVGARAMDVQRNRNRRAGR